MPLRKCENLKCRARNNRAGWLVDGKPTCTSCMEKILEVKGIDGVRVYRLSDRESDYMESSHAATAHRVRA